ncbi:hypothetical protein ACHAWF_010855 [Thalassiosira exigua]
MDKSVQSEARKELNAGAPTADLGRNDDGDGLALRAGKGMLLIELGGAQSCLLIYDVGVELRAPLATASPNHVGGGEFPVEPSGGSDDGVPVPATPLGEEAVIEAIPGVWSRLRDLCERRKARTARRKLRRARKRFERRRKLFDVGAAASRDAIGDNDKEGGEDEGVDDHCFLPPRWHDDESRSREGSIYPDAGGLLLD